MSVTLTWAPCKLAKHLEQRRQVALFVAQGPRDGEQLVGYRGGWQRDAQLLPCVECKRDILLHQADVEPGLVRQVEHETRYPPARKRAAMLPPMCPRPMNRSFLRPLWRSRAIPSICLNVAFAESATALPTSIATRKRR